MSMPHLPTEIVDYINKIAHDMEVSEYRELNRAVRFNSCMKWIEYNREDYETFFTNGGWDFDKEIVEDVPGSSFKDYLTEDIDFFNFYEN